MSKIHIGLIGNVGQKFIDSLPISSKFSKRILSNAPSDCSGCEFVLVGENSVDINLCGAKPEDVEEYIVAVSDLVISEHYSYVCDKARARKGILYLYGDNAKLGLRTMQLTDIRVNEYFKQLEVVGEEIEDDINPCWKNAYSRFFRKFKKKNNSTTYNENIDTNSKMYSMFEVYDAKANKYNSIYRSSLYLRALFPLLATLTLAFAQNTKTFGEFIFGGKYWGVVAAALFIAQALFNYIIIALSNYIVKHYVVENFIHNRYMAESLRMTMILAPNSLPRSRTDRIVFTDVNDRLSAQDNSAKELYRDNYATTNDFTAEKCIKLSDMLKALAHNQLGYHTGNALNCERAEKRITTSAKVMFACGLVAVLGRSVYQLIMQFVNLGSMVHDATIGQFFLSVMNFSALLIPSFTTMFMDFKKTMNISNNRARSQVMSKLLTDYLDALDNIKQPCYLDVYPAASELSDMLMQEALDWNTTTEQQKVSKM